MKIESIASERESRNTSSPFVLIWLSITPIMLRRIFQEHVALLRQPEKWNRKLKKNGSYSDRNCILDITSTLQFFIKC